eukprot:gnl/MRDRNA2_/MRDRNA2_121343_c0_seq1.p1 gnl/MRDRNA2_/MRDRNA2_121343_c0~~gnl/MRDRNA2_/MRDRNA2_121343_c0_seq1.p1  ORF type:complete len:383 (+),score=86.06 gnl/MRDRNA2_/MRDRNA2_121343_c0_seq1:1-1149(+)
MGMGMMGGKGMGKMGMMMPQVSPEDEAKTSAFIEKWGLDERAGSALRASKPAVRQVAIATFSPQEGTTNVSGKFVSFLTKLPAAIEAGTVKTMSETTPLLGMRMNADDSITQFVQTWGLDAGAEQMLRTSSAEVAHRAVTTFKPQGHTTNISGRFIAFLKKLPQAMADGSSTPRSNFRQEEWQKVYSYEYFRYYWYNILTGEITWNEPQASAVEDDPIAIFALRWGLDDRAQQMLQNSHKDVAQQAIATFSPQDTTTNVSGRFVAYLKKLPQAMREGRLAPLDASGKAQAASGGGEMNASVELAISNFVLTWGLDNGAASMLRSSRPALRDYAISNFAPEAGTLNVSGKFVSYLKKLPEQMKAEEQSGTGQIIGSSNKFSPY